MIVEPQPPSPRPARVAARRLASVLVTACVVLGCWAQPAAADPPHPTDYRSRVLGIEPPVGGVDARIVGGDSFVEVIVARGHRVTVAGYGGEPYLRVLADGTVQENRHSPAAYLNRSMYGTASVPAGASTTATPSWARVGSGGVWVWHDHRTHWMGLQPPPSQHPGQVILSGTVPITVDGRAAVISVNATWEPPPSPVPVVAGVLVVIAAWLMAGRRFGRVRAAIAATGAAAVAAAVVGVWEVRSYPAEVGTSPLVWILPAVAAALIAQALVRRRPVHDAAPLTAAVALGVWVVLRLAVLWRPVLPTSAPFWLDRAVTASSATAALVLVGHAVAAVVATGGDWSKIIALTRSP